MLRGKQIVLSKVLVGYGLSCYEQLSVFICADLCPKSITDEINNFVSRMYGMNCVPRRYFILL